MSRGPFLFICLLLQLVIPVAAQTPSWIWARTAAGNNNEEGTTIRTDAYGNSYVGGGFTAHYVTFGSFTLTNTQLSGARDIFLVKYDKMGNVLWARSAGGAFQDYVNSISIDDSGNCYMTGEFKGYSLDFGTYVLVNPDYNINNSGDIEIFVAKYDASGTLLWAKAIGGPDVEQGTGVDADQAGNVFVTGTFEGQWMAIDSFYFNHTGSSGSTRDFFVMKLDPNANFIWAKTSTGMMDESSVDIELDSSANIIVGGYFNSVSFLFDSVSLYHANFAGYDDSFIAKLDSSGNVMWMDRIGDTLGLDDNLSDIDIDQWGYIYTAGTFETQNLTFGPDSLLNPNGLLEGFVARFNPAGQPLWGRSIAGDEYEWANGVVADHYGNIFITGNYSSDTVHFANAVLTNSNHVNGYTDIYVASYDSSGTFRWCNKAGGWTTEKSAAIAIDTAYNCYITGASSSGQMSFGSITLALNNPNATTFVEDYFAAKIGFPNLVGGPDISDDVEISIAPNPSDGRFRIHAVDVPEEMIITDITGKVIRSEKPSTGEFMVELAPGTYFFTFITKGRSLTKKVVVF